MGQVSILEEIEGWLERVPDPKEFPEVLALLDKVRPGASKRFDARPPLPSVYVQQKRYRRVGEALRRPYQRRSRGTGIVGPCGICDEPTDMEDRVCRDCCYELSSAPLDVVFPPLAWAEIPDYLREYRDSIADRLNVIEMRRTPPFRRQHESGRRIRPRQTLPFDSFGECRGG